MEVGRESSFNLDFEAGLLKVKATAEGKPNKDLLWWYIYPMTAGGERAATPLFQVQEAELEAAAPVGELIVTVDVNQVLLPDIRIKVVKGKVTELTVHLPK